MLLKANFSGLRRRSISEPALLKRINGKLAKSRAAIRRTRAGSRMELSCGVYYHIDYEFNALVESHVDIEALGRQLGVLGGMETLTEACA